ncbi:MAG TPA: ShlB/FhaC/HecB family hemolysin secretion/activation protein [Gammaproteobacteria bacterium]|nr:ShlB/FhaC/HecB family hemolysin secretion/activation protein [Gammaproteobacteria bacterium]
MNTSWLKACLTAVGTIVLTVGFLLYTTPVLAQVPNPPPTGGVVEETLPEPERPLPEAQAPEVETPVPERAPAPDDGPTVMVQQFVISGNTLISDATLQAALEPHLNYPQTLADLYAAADTITALYRERGYGLAQTVLPAQRVNSGIVRLEILEGRIGKIVVRGNTDYDADQLLAFASALQPGQIYRTADMERAILLLNDLPGLTARAVLQPGAAYGTVDITLEVTEDHWDFRASLDNHGREELGKIRALMEADWHNSFHYGDEFSGALLYSEDGLLAYGSLAYSLPIGTDGGRLQFSVNKADYEVAGAAFAFLGITGDNTNVRVDYSYPVIRSRDTNLIFVTGISHNQAETLIFDAQIPLNETELNLLEVGLFWNRVFAGGSSLDLSTLLSTNFKSIEDTEPGDPNGQQAKLTIDANWRVPFGRWSFITRASAAYSPDPLVDTQKFSLGGPYSVRAYVPAEARGDKGLFVSTELQRHFRLGSNNVLSVGAFVDAGTVERYPVAAGLGDLEDSLAGAGLSLTLTSNSWYHASLSWATPIGNHKNTLDPTFEYEDQVWVQLSASF